MSQRNNCAETNANKIIMLKQMQIKYLSGTFLNKTIPWDSFIKKLTSEPQKKSNIDNVIGTLIISVGHL